MDKRKTLNAVKQKYWIKKYSSDWYGDFYSIYCFGDESDYYLQLEFIKKVEYIKKDKIANLVIQMFRTGLNSNQLDIIYAEIQKKYKNIEYFAGGFYILNIDQHNVIENIETLKEAMLYASKLPICENTKFQNLQEYDKFPFFS